MYTTPYFATKKNPVILLCLVIYGNPYPVVEKIFSSENFRGKPLVTGFQSHYVVVHKAGDPVSVGDYETGIKTYDELVIEQESQIVPIFLLKVRLQNMSELIADFGRELPTPQINTPSPLRAPSIFKTALSRATRPDDYTLL